MVYCLYLIEKKVEYHCNNCSVSGTNQNDEVYHMCISTICILLIHFFSFIYMAKYEYLSLGNFFLFYLLFLKSELTFNCRFVSFYLTMCMLVSVNLDSSISWIILLCINLVDIFFIFFLFFASFLFSYVDILLDFWFNQKWWL